MKYLLFMSLTCLSWVAAEAEPPAEPTRPSAPLSLIVELTDGSLLVGTAEIDAVPFVAKYGRMNLAMKEVVAVKFSEDQETGKVTMKNGDSFQGVLDLVGLGLRTLLGELSVPMRHVSRITVTRGPVRPGLVLYYSFDSKDEVTRDLSGKGNHGKIHGARWTPKGKVGGAYEFDGKAAYIQKDYDERSEVFPKKAPLSIAVWFKTSTPAPRQPMLVSTHIVGIHHGYFLSLTGPAGGKAAWWIAEGAATSRSSVGDGRWHQAVVVWEGKETSIYIDGVLESSAATRGTTDYSSNVPFRIGHSLGEAGDRMYYFSGTIDEVMVFNRALSAKEVQFLWKSP